MLFAANQRRIQRLALFALASIIVTYLLLDRLPFDVDWQIWRHASRNFDWEHRALKYLKNTLRAP